MVERRKIARMVSDRIAMIHLMRNRIILTGKMISSREREERNDMMTKKEDELKVMSKYVKVDVPQQDKVQQVISRRQQSKWNLVLLCTRECTHT